MINTQHLIHIQYKNEQKWAKVVEVTAEGKLVTMRTDEGDTLMMETEGQDRIPDPPRGHPTNLLHPCPTIAADRTGSHIWHRRQEKGQEKDRMGPSDIPPPSLTTGVRNDTLEDELTELRSGEQVFMTIRPKLIGAGYTTLDSIPRIQKGSRTRFYCLALKGVDSKTQESATRWIQLLHKYPAHLHALNIKDAQKQRDPEIEPLEGMTTSKLADKYIVKQNKIRNQCTLLRG